MASLAFTGRMRSHAPRLRLRIAVLLGLLILLVAGAAVASAASLIVPAGGAANASGATGMHPGASRTFSLPVAGLTPGETVRGRELLVNDEAQSLRFAMRSASVDTDEKGVRDIVRVTIRTADHGTGSEGTCDRFDGPTLYDGPLGAETAGFGDVTMGGQSGDRILAPGQRETLCFEVGMPLDAGNEYQGATTSTSWTIVAEQETGNP